MQERKFIESQIDAIRGLMEAAWKVRMNLGNVKPKNKSSVKLS